MTIDERAWQRAKSIRWVLWGGVLFVFGLLSIVSYNQIWIVVILLGPTVCAALIAGWFERKARLRIPRFQK